MERYLNRRLDLLTSKQVASYLERSDLAILPVGCVEMHGPLVPLGCDTACSYALALMLAQRWDCLCMPAVPYVFPGASAQWPGTIEVGIDASTAYIRAVAEAALDAGFARLVLFGTHGPLSTMFQTVIRSIYTDSRRLVLAVSPHQKVSELMTEEFGTSGEDIYLLGALKVLGLEGAYQPAADVDLPQEPPVPAIGELRRFGAAGPWQFTRDYQHTGVRRGLSLDDADRVIRVFDRYVEEMADLPDHYERFRQQMESAQREKPWLGEGVWSV